MDAGCKSLISGSPQFSGSKEESMVCALRCYGVTDSGQRQKTPDTFMPGAKILTSLYGRYSAVAASLISS
ncbi:MAG: hypothetical protein P8X74_21280 [Reinekea sp.]